MALKVLFAEDDEAIQLIVKLGLVDIGGMELVLVNNGAEALDSLKTFRPDVIVTDVNMPVMSGQELMVELSKSDDFKNIPTIFLSAETNLELKRELMKLGAVAVLCKPFNPLTLAKVILDILVKLKVEGTHGP